MMYGLKTQISNVKYVIHAMQRSKIFGCLKHTSKRGGARGSSIMRARPNHPGRGPPRHRLACEVNIKKPINRYPLRPGLGAPPRTLCHRSTGGAARACMGRPALSKLRQKPGSQYRTLAGQTPRQSAPCQGSVVVITSALHAEGHGFNPHP